MAENDVHIFYDNKDVFYDTYCKRFIAETPIITRDVNYFDDDQGYKDSFNLQGSIYFDKCFSSDAFCDSSGMVQSILSNGWSREYKLCYGNSYQINDTVYLSGVAGYTDGCYTITGITSTGVSLYGFDTPVLKTETFATTATGEMLLFDETLFRQFLIQNNFHRQFRPFTIFQGEHQSTFNCSRYFIQTPNLYFDAANFTGTPGTTKLLIVNNSGIANGVYDLNSFSNGSGVIAVPGQSNYNSPISNHTFFKVGSETQLLYNCPAAYVDGVDFDESKYAGYAPFNIGIECVSDGAWGNIGVDNPVDEYSYSFNNSSIELTHKVSARGFHTRYNDALTNAKNWVEARTGIPSNLTPFLIPHFSDPVLLKLNQTVNRFDGSYEITEEYAAKTGYIGDGILYTNNFEVSSGDGFSTITVNGELNGGLNSSSLSLRQKVNSIDLYGLCTGKFYEVSPETLYESPLAFNVEEDLQNHRLTFSAQYSTEPTGVGAYLVDEFNIEEDFNNGRTCVTLNASIKSKLGLRANRNLKINQFYSGFDFDSYIRSKYAEMGYGGILEYEPRNKTKSFDPFNSEIRVSRTLCTIDSNPPEGIKYLDYTVNIQPSLTKFISNPSCVSGGVYIYQNLGYKNRSSVSIDGNATILANADNKYAVNNLLQFIDTKVNTYFSGSNKILEDQKIDWDKTNKSKEVSFSFSWSYFNSRDFQDINYLFI